MTEIKASSYSVYISNNSSEIINQFFEDRKNKYSKVFILVDENTIKHCYPQLVANVPFFESAEIIEIESGEENKNIEVCTQIWTTLSEYGGDRKSLFINIGGGVISDMGGFIASTFKRGIDFVNIPTTLLSQVDASVGGKLGIDLNHLKNEIGVFNNPQAVFVDPTFIKTLEKRQVDSGFAEMIKHALIADANYWKQIKEIDFNDVDSLCNLIDISVRIKNDVVLADPFEKNIRKTLNFGHTIGHAIETHYLEDDKLPTLLHGEAIAIGMICEGYLSNKLSGLSDADLKEMTDYILSVYEGVDIDVKLIDRFLSLMQHDKKNEKGVLNFSLLSTIGKCEINVNVSADLIKESLHYYTEKVKKKYRLIAPANRELKGEITLTASKSESNRALIIQAICEDAFEIKNLAAAEDTRVLKEILGKVKTVDKSKEHTYDVGAAGTTMRFLTAYLSTVEGTHILTGTERMKNRPIKILVDALRELGADIEYLEKDGYPPMRINGKELKGGQIEIDGGVSSQYISALLLVSSKFTNGLTLRFKGEVTSKPYISMTLRMLNKFLFDVEWVDGSINVDAIKNKEKNKLRQLHVPTVNYEVSGDWSSASYWYALASLSKSSSFIIRGLDGFETSLQGDSKTVEIFSQLGVKSVAVDRGYKLVKEGELPQNFSYDFSDCPDLAQTVAVVVGTLNIPSVFTGLHTLRIKETDRSMALKNELAKVEVEVNIVSDDEIHIQPKSELANGNPIATYEDHRMAMAFAVLAMKNGSIEIEDPEVVKKSYPDFWNDLEKVGFTIESE